jgi:hypothetical protein
MAKPTAIVVDQRRETGVTELSFRWGRLRYAYARAFETRQANERGQDSLILNILDSAVSFSLCDGVSMSFMGDVAAHYLGQQLLKDFPGLLKSLAPDEQVETRLAQHLLSLTSPAKKLIQDYHLPDNVLPMVRSVLEEKRAMGSESMFIYGQLDFQQELVSLVWMGDSRLRLWRHTQEVSEACLGDGRFNTRERWSTQHGPLGQVHVWQGALSAITRLLTYSDGLGAYDEPLDKPVSSPAIQEMIQAQGDCPTSDDISLIELDF